MIIFATTPNNKTGVLKFNIIEELERRGKVPPKSSDSQAMKIVPEHRENTTCDPRNSRLKNAHSIPSS